MVYNKIVMIILAVIIASLSGCATNRYQEPKDVDLVQVSYDAAKTLQEKLRKPLPQNGLIVVSTIVNVDNLNETSSFGRIVSDQIASAFNNSGYRIMAMEMPTELFVEEEDGLLRLSDKTEQVLGTHNAAALVIGVFAPGRRTAYVSLLVVDIETKTIISSTDFSVPMGPDAKVLLEPKKIGSAGPHKTSESNPASN